MESFLHEKTKTKKRGRSAGGYMAHLLMCSGCDGPCHDSMRQGGLSVGAVSPHDAAPLGLSSFNGKNR